MRDRTIRNLANLNQSASTARVLNLLTVSQDHGRDPEWRARPMFRDRRLNQAIFIKHRLRRDEIDRFRRRRFVGTKVILPIDETDLSLGGRYLFVGQIGYDLAMAQNFGLEPDSEDARTLRLLDQLPGLDPFLLREQLRRHGVEPAACYFNLSTADLDRMTAFVATEITSLVDLSLGEGADLAAENPVARLTAKILSSRPGGDLQTLGQTFRLRPSEYQEGVFCWKGFLYYKWSLASLIGEIGQVSESVRTVKPRGRPDPLSRITLERSRARIRELIVETCDDASGMLRVYDTAYAELTRHGRPAGFRDFLLAAPDLFAQLGERLGAIQHIVSFWRYRFQRGKAQPDVAELIDLFADFETSLTGRDREPEARTAIAA
ncbi:hypothetical protein [Brevundimonas balnearis]|uniref:Uncharacterized protein n=1 Tax=Brevundimonas balnearis TaxID=1572858 RepID=A0ABV6R3X0_9CAUL